MRLKVISATVVSVVASIVSAAPLARTVASVPTCHFRSPAAVLALVRSTYGAGSRISSSHCWIYDSRHPKYPFFWELGADEIPSGEDFQAFVRSSYVDARLPPFCHFANGDLVAKTVFYIQEVCRPPGPPLQQLVTIAFKGSSSNRGGTQTTWFDGLGEGGPQFPGDPLLPRQVLLRVAGLAQFS